MMRRAAYCLIAAAGLLLFACGGDGLALFSRAAATDLSIIGPTDGSVFTSTQPIALQIAMPEPAGDLALDVEVTLTTPEGDTVWQTRIADPALNEDLGLQLPELPAGAYRLQITALQDGAQSARRTVTIFTVDERPRIASITSFPPLITASSPVLFNAEISSDSDSDPWLRWTWRGATIAQGAASAGATAVLWRAPAGEGVYTVTLELFPAAPSMDERFAFRSPIAMSTEIYVAAAGAVVRDELGPASSYLSLFHLEADLVDAAAASRNLERAALPVGSPRVVPVGDGFGYRLEGGAGLRVPWPVLPVEGGELAPFTLSVGVRAERLTGSDRIVTVTAGALVIALGLDTAASPALVVTAPNVQPLSIPSGAPSLEQGRRYLVSASVEPLTDGLRVRWFLDGLQVSESAVGLPLPRPGSEGSAIVGGQSDFAAIIDEFGIYARDEAGRPATDPSLFRSAMRRQHGDRLLFAEGFDGLHLASGLAVTGDARLTAGSLALQPEAALELPPIRFPAEGFSVEVRLDDDSERAADVQLAWAGTQEPFVVERLAAESGSIVLSFTAETVTGRTAGGVRSWAVPKPPAEKAGIVVRVGCPRNARSAVLISEIAALATAVK